MPGPGAYEYDNYSIQSSPSRAPRFFQVQTIKNQRFESPRGSMMSQTATIPDIYDRPVQKPKKPMKTSLSINKSQKGKILKIDEGELLNIIKNY